MLERVRTFLHERRRTFATAAGVAGTVYLTGKYLMERLEEMRHEAMELQRSRENLRKRFQQNQEDIGFITMTHLSTLGNSIISGMDVEKLTRELKMISGSSVRRSLETSSGSSASSNALEEDASQRSRNIPTSTTSPKQPPSECSMTSSVELSHPLEPTSSSTVSVSSPTNETNEESSSVLGDSVSMLSASVSTNTQSWVAEFSSQLGSSTMGEAGAFSELTLSGPSTRTSMPSPISLGTGLSNSVKSDSLVSSSESEKQHERSNSSGYSSLPTKTKAELWNEIKLLTFTRTLTIIYSTTLLSLLTTMQLNIVGRAKYVDSVIQLQRDERTRERRITQASVSSLFFGSPDDESEDVNEALELGSLSAETEKKFLTLSWWLLYVGWKDIGERVRKSVEEVFDGVSLKSRLGPMEIHRLVYDVRRRVENEVTYEGTERRINFLSTIVPPTPEMLALVFGEGNVPGYKPSARSEPNLDSDHAFASLLNELRQTATSPAFAAMLEACLDRATDVLTDGLRKNVFRTMDKPQDGSQEIEIPRLASLLPGLARWSHLALNTVPNELVDSILDLRETRSFSAILYSTYTDRFL